MSTPNILALANVINISVSTPQTGIGALNTSNVALFTRDTPGTTFGVLGYAIYLSPTQVGIDFGTSSATYLMATTLFSQQPNILNNGGYLVIIPYLSAAQTAVQVVSFPGTPTSGTFELTYGGAGSTTALAATASASAVQTALRLVTGLTTVTVAGSIPAGLTVTFTGVTGAATLLTISANSLADALSNTITPTVVTTQVGSSAETLDAAINRTANLVQYFGVMSTEVETQAVILCAALTVQALNKLLFYVSYTTADTAPAGTIDLIRTGSFTQTRALYYGGTLTTALEMKAAYVGRGLSVNFNGSNTTLTMHLKVLTTIQPDPTMTQTILNACELCGADTYVSIAGAPGVFCVGANDFFDNQYNLQWFVINLQVAGFNALATVSTKVPQTENGMAILKGAYRLVCEQAVTNQFLAPGAWTSPTTFGNQADLLANVSQRGYYIYSVPVSQQLPSVRVTRAAPLVQIAAKYAGAIQSSQVIVNVNP